MSIKKLSDLLPVNDNNSKPHAYEVFGLSVGESNPDIIRESIELTIAKVKAAKSETEPALWKQIAGIVQTARLVLSDPEKKSRLDARLGSGSQAKVQPTTKTVASKPVDPLAALLPPVNPMQPIASQQPTPSAPSPPPTPMTKTPVPTGDVPNAVNPMPPGVFSTHPLDQNTIPDARKPVASAEPFLVNQVPEAHAAVEPPVTSPVTASPVVRKKARRPVRRKKSIMVPLFMSVVTLALISMVGLLAYALVFDKQTISISRDDGSLTIASNKTDQPPPKPGTPKLNSPATNQSGANSKELQSPGKPPTPMNSEPQIDSVPNRPDPEPEFKLDPQLAPERPFETKSERRPKTDPVPKVKAVEPEVSVSPPMQPSPEKTSAIFEMEKATRVEVDPDKFRDAIRKADWTEMAKIAEMIHQLQLSAEDEAEIEGPMSVADLAIYYRKGIEKAVANLASGNDFEVANGFRVVVVDKTDQSLTVRYNAKNQEFKFDAMPLSLAHKLASFQVPDGPSGKAAKAVYQAIAPKSTLQHREQAIAWIREIDQPIEDADAETLIQTLQSIFDVN